MTPDDPPCPHAHLCLMFCHPILTIALQKLSPHFIDEDIKAGRGLRSGLKWLAHVEELGGSRGFRGLSFCPGRGTHTEVSPFFLQTSVSSPVDGGPSLAFPSGTKEFRGALARPQGPWSQAGQKQTQGGVEGKGAQRVSLPAASEGKAL